MANRDTPSKLSLQYRKLIKSRKDNSPGTASTGSAFPTPSSKQFLSGTIFIESSDEEDKENRRRSRDSNAASCLGSRRNSTILAGNLTILDSDDDESVSDRVSVLSDQPHSKNSFAIPRQRGGSSVIPKNKRNYKAALHEITEDGEEDFLTEDETRFYSCDETNSQDDEGLNRGCINTHLSSETNRYSQINSTNQLRLPIANSQLENTESLKLALSETSVSNHRSGNTPVKKLQSFAESPKTPGNQDSPHKEQGTAKSSRIISTQKPALTINPDIILVDSSDEDSENDQPLLAKRLNFNSYREVGKTVICSDDELPSPSIPSPSTHLLSNSKIQRVTSWLSELSPSTSHSDVIPETRVHSSLISDDSIISEMRSEVSSVPISSQSDGTSKAQGSWNYDINSEATSKGNYPNSSINSHSSLSQSYSQATSKAGGSKKSLSSLASSQSVLSQSLSQRTSKAGGSQKSLDSSKYSQSFLSQGTSKREVHKNQANSLTKSSTSPDSLALSQATSKAFGHGYSKSPKFQSKTKHKNNETKSGQTYQQSFCSSPKSFDNPFIQEKSTAINKSQRHSGNQYVPLSCISMNSTQSSSIKANFVYGNDSVDIINHTVQSRIDLVKSKDGRKTMAKKKEITIDNSVNAVRAWTSIQESEINSITTKNLGSGKKCSPTDDSSSEDDLDRFLSNLKTTRTAKKKSSDEDEDFIVPDDEVESSEDYDSPGLSLEERIRQKLGQAAVEERKPARKCKPTIKLSYSSESEDELPSPEVTKKKLEKSIREKSKLPITQSNTAKTKSVIKKSTKKGAITNFSPSTYTPPMRTTTGKKNVIRSDSESRSPSPILIASGSDSEDDTPVRKEKPIVFATPKPATSKGKVKSGSLFKEAEIRGTPTTLTFLSSLTIDTPKYRCHPDAIQYLDNFKKKKEELAKRLYHLYNKEVFEGCLPADMEITWNVRLTKTAGLCYSKRYRSKFNVETRSSRIELSSKVIDSGDRLRDTLVHEMCHAASWIISGYRDGHGPLWRTWADKAMKRFPELPVIDRCHSYQIRTKYNYVCEKCGYTIGRHSKSLDTEKKVCGHCHGRFKLVVNATNIRKDQKSDSRPTATPKTPNAFALFVKENYKIHKKPGVAHKDVMAILSTEFSKVKLNK